MKLLKIAKETHLLVFFNHSSGVIFLLSWNIKRLFGTGIKTDIGAWQNDSTSIYQMIILYPINIVCKNGICCIQGI